MSNDQNEQSGITVTFPSGDEAVFDQVSAEEVEAYAHAVQMAPDAAVHLALRQALRGVFGAQAAPFAPQTFIDPRPAGDFPSLYDLELGLTSAQDDKPHTPRAKVVHIDAFRRERNKQ